MHQKGQKEPRPFALGLPLPFNSAQSYWAKFLCHFFSLRTIWLLIINPNKASYTHCIYAKSLSRLAFNTFWKWWSPKACEFLSTPGATPRLTSKALEATGMSQIFLPLEHCFSREEHNSCANIEFGPVGFCSHVCYTFMQWMMLQDISRVINPRTQESNKMHLSIHSDTNPWVKVLLSLTFLATSLAFYVPYL